MLYCVNSRWNEHGLREERWLRLVEVEKLREQKGVEWDEDDNFEHMWEQVKRATVEKAREVCGSMRRGMGRIQRGMMR